MAKEQLPKPIHFQAHLFSESSAKMRFDELVKRGCYKDIYLISTTHWAGLGFWIMFEVPDLNPGMDKLIKHKHNPNPKPWVPPVRFIDEDQENEGDEE